MVRCWWLAALSALFTLTGAPLGAQERAAFAVEPFILRGFDGMETAAEMGRLRVPADRADPRGGAVDLAFVRLPSTAEAPGSPIMFLAGGPGVPGIVKIGRASCRGRV